MILMTTYVISCSVECIMWVAESMRSFSIVEDPGFQCLMKNGRPTYRIPPASMVAQDIRVVYTHTRERIAKMLQVILASKYGAGFMYLHCLRHTMAT